MICRYCQQEMTLDDCDYNFKGNYDNYWVCERCGVSYFESIRFGKFYKGRWHKGEKEKTQNDFL